MVTGGSMKTAFFLLLTVSLTVSSQPVALKFACTAEDIDLLGLSCSEEDPCPVFLELSSVESVGSRLLVAGNLHTERNTLYSILLSSEDGGKTWTEPHNRIRGATLDQLQFVDFQHGFVGGSIIGSLPRDPFFLVTTDGGKSWRDRPVFDEGRIGTISQFYFDSKTNGTMVFDRTKRPEDGNRYELLETMTGGDTWLPKQYSSRPLQLRKSHLGAEDRGWRLHEDSRSKTIQLEQRADKWIRMAVFPIRVGECKPPEPKPATGNNVP
jgi:photosystem II stability/assembly factor-like uncharacterized protein